MLYVQRQLQAWSEKALAEQRCSPQSEPLIALLTASPTLLMHMLNSLWSTAIVTSNQVSRIIFCAPSDNFSLLCQRRSCANLNASERFCETDFVFQAQQRVERFIVCNCGFFGAWGVGVSPWALAVQEKQHRYWTKYSQNHRNTQVGKMSQIHTPTLQGAP